MREVTPPNAKLVPPQAKRVFKGEIYDVYQWNQAMFDGSTGIFEMIKRPDSVNILAIKDNKIVILDEVQPFEGEFRGLPAGRHDHADETELQAAQRELREETGMIFNTWRLLSATQYHHKIDHIVYVFLATDFDHQTEPTPDPGEKITINLMTLDEVKALRHDPKTRFVPNEILDRVNSIEELLALPAYQTLVN